MLITAPNQKWERGAAAARSPEHLRLQDTKTTIIAGASQHGEGERRRRDLKEGGRGGEGPERMPEGLLEEGRSCMMGRGGGKGRGRCSHLSHTLLDPPGRA